MELLMWRFTRTNCGEQASSLLVTAGWKPAPDDLLTRNERSYYFSARRKMTMFPAFDDFNPKFLFFSPVRSAAVDKNQLSEHVDHAIIALDGRAPIGGGCCLEQLEPVTGASTLRVELWVNDLDDYTCTYGFLVSSEN